MGTRSRVVITYGFILSEEETERLLAVLEAMGEEDTIQDWLEERAEKETAPFYFSAVNGKYREPSSWDEKGGMELAFTFLGQAGNPFADDPELEVWGREGMLSSSAPVPHVIDLLIRIGGSGFLPIPEKKNEKLMNAAKEGFKKLLSTRLFQRAEIPDVVPQWIVTLDVG
ncbi:hypothetical protein C0992_006377 [Termitomyces sp. T32_za158]|nr:hypothetical protein C0992_006377 [Termitomyces sp. T32_za158]